MILIDTTVWIDFFTGHNQPQVIQLINLLENRDELCICGVILTEILQGIKNKKEQQLIEEHLNYIIFLEMTRSTFILAADIFRLLRSQGITVRKTIDCMIAAVAIENDIMLLHKDRDFNPIEKHCGLKVLQPRMV